jgi:hypothetical protein
VFVRLAATVEKMFCMYRTIQNNLAIPTLASCKYL